VRVDGVLLLPAQIEEMDLDHKMEDINIISALQVVIILYLEQ
jgi:hypothetical protein